MAADYLKMFEGFFTKRVKMSSTYKPILLRSLLDIGDLDDPKRRDEIVGRYWLERRNGRLTVDLNFVAARFAKYYWDMKYSFKLRQSQSPNDANIVRMIEECHKGRKKPPTIQELAGDEMADFRKKVINKSIKPQPLRYLLTDMPKFYEKTAPNAVSFDEEIVQFMHKHKTVLRKGINNILTKYLERVNRSTPSIANKVDCEIAGRIQLPRKIRDYIQTEQESKCFYCQERMNSSRCQHIDHVIPYNYVFSTDPYNCVLACQRCNCAKSDRLPERRIFTGVLERNDCIKEEILRSFESAYEKSSYERLFEACADEYNGSDFFTPPLPPDATGG